ncbi:unnamed protein product [Ceutorhynchus assimilis]|uniref:Uncharacterized protein n=1 Tax=Ceutorhynchus assimilis TaxID=467358 RepID=A0A9N9Q8U8_9CUCU|nr:unnamed protein product [Ceutorhynchus assimilis]
MKFAFQNLIIIFSFVIYNYLCLAKDYIKVGVFFNKDQSTENLDWNVIQDNLNLQLQYQVSEIPETDSFAVAKIFCRSVSENGLSIVFGPSSIISSDMIGSMCSTFQIPFISTHYTHMSTKEYPNNFNLYPDANLFSQGLATIVKSLDWDVFVIIYENEESLAKLQDVLKIYYVQGAIDRNTVLLKHLGPGPDYRPLLKDVTKLTPSRRIILDCHVDKITEVLLQGKEVKLLDDFSTSIFLSSMDAHTLDFQQLNIITNITTIRLFDPKSDVIAKAVKQYYSSIVPGKLRVETALRHDAMLLFAKSINSLLEKNPEIDIISEPKFCNASDKYAIDRIGLINEMQQTILTNALTGEIISLENGKRLHFNLEVIEITNPDKPIGIWTSESPEDIHLTRNATEREQELQKRMQSYNFIVSSKLGQPYLMETNDTGAVGNSRYRGFSMDLITEIAKIMNITFQFTLAYKNLQIEIVEDLVNRRADLGICDFTITQQRNEKIDFSLPFMSLGISILHKKTEQEEISNMYGFMKPLTWTVWIYITTLYLVISIVILFIARLDPDDWENPHPCDLNPEELENIWGIKNCLWLTLGSIMAQGCDILPKGSCSRIATAMWWFFSLIMTSTYTANMAAFLTMSRQDDSIKGVEDLANQNKVKYGVMAGGSTQSFFETSNNSLYQKMWATMSNENPSVFEDSNAKGVERVLNTKQGLYAFFMESPQIEYELERNCDLKKIGQYLDSKSYGIGMPLGAVYRHQINTAVLQLKENGKINELKEKWWKQEDLEGPPCPNDSLENNKDELTLANVGGAFILLAAGIGLAFLLAITEFLWNIRHISAEEHMTYFETLKSELKFACNITVTRKAAKPIISSSSSSRSTDDDRSISRTILAGAGSVLNINASVLNRLGQGHADFENEDE